MQGPVCKEQATNKLALQIYNAYTAAQSYAPTAMFDSPENFEFPVRNCCQDTHRTDFVLHDTSLVRQIGLFDLANFVC